MDSHPYVSPGINGGTFLVGGLPAVAQTGSTAFVSTGTYTPAGTTVDISGLSHGWFDNTSSSASGDSGSGTSGSNSTPTGEAAAATGELSGMAGLSFMMTAGQMVGAADAALTMAATNTLIDAAHLLVCDGNSCVSDPWRSDTLYLDMGPRSDTHYDKIGINSAANTNGASEEFVVTTKAALEEKVGDLAETINRLNQAMVESDDPAFRDVMQSQKESYAGILNETQKQLGAVQTGAAIVSNPKHVTPDNYGNTYRSHWSGQERGSLRIAGATATAASLLATAPVSIPVAIIAICWFGAGDQLITGTREVFTDENHNTLLTAGVTHVTGSETAGHGAQIAVDVTMILPGLYQVTVGGIRYFVAAQDVADASLKAAQAGRDGLTVVETIKEIHDVKNAADMARAGNAAARLLEDCANNSTLNLEELTPFQRQLMEDQNLVDDLKYMRDMMEKLQDGLHGAGEYGEADNLNNLLMDMDEQILHLESIIRDSLRNLGHLRHLD